jgi:hypothetical protein
LATSGLAFLIKASLFVWQVIHSSLATCVGVGVAAVVGLAVGGIVGDTTGVQEGMTGGIVLAGVGLAAGAQPTSNKRKITPIPYLIVCRMDFPLSLRKD